MVKRILIIVITFLIAISGFMTGFFSVGCMSVYASVNDDDIYVPLREPSDLVVGFQYYCKSRDLTIEGSLSDAITTFTTGAFNSACNELGINVSQLQAEIKAEYDSSGKPVKFLFNDTGVMAMNRIFAQFLQDNELEVGDTVEEQTLYSGEYFVDDNGNSCLVYVANVDFSGSHNMSVIVNGTPFIKDSYNYVVNLDIPMDTPTVLYSFVYRGNTYNYQINKHHWGRVTQYGTITPFDGYYGWQLDGSDVLTSYIPGWGAIYKANNNRYYYGIAGNQTKWIGEISNVQSNNVVIFLTTNNTVINNNNYEGDTIINYDGDIIEPLPDPKNPNDTITNVPETPITPNDDGGWDIDLPDIDIPNLPIGNLSEKFPFSIPWDLVAFYAMLDADPEAPRFNGTMDLTLVQWNYDIDLSPFDSAAELCRKLQFGLFVVGLIVASRSIIRG